MAAVEREIVSTLEGFSGQLLGPGDDGYDDARRKTRPSIAAPGGGGSWG
jgi:hypothetical protein